MHDWNGAIQNYAKAAKIYSDIYWNELLSTMVELSQIGTIEDASEKRKPFDPKTMAESSTRKEFLLTQGEQRERPRYPQSGDSGPQTNALTAAEADPLLAGVSKALRLKDTKEAQKQADQLLNALSEKHDKASKELAQISLELGALFQQSNATEAAKGFYTRGIDVAKVALGKHSGKRVLMADLYSSLTGTQVSMGDWNGAIQNYAKAAKIYSDIYWNELLSTVFELPEEKLGKEFFEKMRDNHLLGAAAYSGAGQKEKATLALRGAAEASFTLRRVKFKSVG